MNKLKEFYNSFAFIITFMFMTVLISAFIGEKFLNKFLLLILASQLVLNKDEVIKLIDKVKVSEDKIVKEKPTYSIDSYNMGDIHNGILVGNGIAQTENKEVISQIEMNC